MNTVLGIGISHYPPLMGRDRDMGENFTWALSDPCLPAERRNTAAWPIMMRTEWAEDHGQAAAARHRATLVEHLRHCRQALDAFAPDIVIVLCDDQYELAGQAAPTFQVMAFERHTAYPFLAEDGSARDNPWGRPPNWAVPISGAVHDARKLAESLTSEQFDVSYTQLGADDRFPGRVVATQVVLDYDESGSMFRYPLVPLTIDCFGTHAKPRHSGKARMKLAEGCSPVGPSPARCYDLGAALARWASATPSKVALVASASWSHAFLNDASLRLQPDLDSDRFLYQEMVDQRWSTWRNLAVSELIAAGQHSLLPWCVLLGAMAEVGLSLTWSSLIPTCVFHSTKSFAIFDALAGASGEERDRSQQERRL